VTTGIVVKARVVAVLNFVDDDENDHKIVCVPVDDRNSTAHIDDLVDLCEQWKKQIEYHFNHYKDLKKPGTTKVEGWGDKAHAWEIIRACSDRYQAN
jgi:inorganic pyrophosphatase